MKARKEDDQKKRKEKENSTTSKINGKLLDQTMMKKPHIFFHIKHKKRKSQMAEKSLGIASSIVVENHLKFKREHTVAVSYFFRIRTAHCAQYFDLHFCSKCTVSSLEFQLSIPFGFPLQHIHFDIYP